MHIISCDGVLQAGVDISDSLRGLLKEDGVHAELAGGQDVCSNVQDKVRIM